MSTSTSPLSQPERTTFTRARRHGFIAGGLIFWLGLTMALLAALTPIALDLLRWATIIIGFSGSLIAWIHVMWCIPYFRNVPKHAEHTLKNLKWWRLWTAGTTLLLWLVAIAANFFGGWASGYLTISLMAIATLLLVQGLQTERWAKLNTIGG